MYTLVQIDDIARRALGGWNAVTREEVVTLAIQARIGIQLHGALEMTKVAMERTLEVAREAAETTVLHRATKRSLERDAARLKAELTQREAWTAAALRDAELMAGILKSQADFALEVYSACRLFTSDANPMEKMAAVASLQEKATQVMDSCQSEPGPHPLLTEQAAAPADPDVERPC